MTIEKYDEKITTEEAEEQAQYLFNYACISCPLHKTMKESQKEVIQTLGITERQYYAIIRGYYHIKWSTDSKSIIKDFYRGITSILNGKNGNEYISVFDGFGNDTVNILVNVENLEVIEDLGYIDYCIR